MDRRPVRDRQQDDRLGRKMAAVLDPGRRPLHNLGRGRFGLSAGAHPASPRRPCRSGARSISAPPSDFFMPPKGTSAANLLKSETRGKYAAYAEAIDNPYLVGSPVVRERAQDWSLDQDTVPTARPKAKSNPLEFCSTGASGVQWFLTVSKTQPIPVCGIPYRYRSALRAQIAFAVPPFTA
jgi:hypothetical protein